jgi:AAA15 family ATPase/GTPase
LSLVASDEEHINDDEDLTKDNTFEVPEYDLRLLKSAVIYGANASGKSILLGGVNYFSQLVNNNFADNLKSEIQGIVPFLLNEETENQPTEFEVVFINDNKVFRYGVEITSHKVVSE